MGQKIAVFSGNLSYSVRKGIVEIDRACAGLEWLIVVHAPRKGAAMLIRSQFRNLRRNGWRWIPYQTGDIMQRFPRRRGQHAPSGPGDMFSLAALEALPNVRILYVADIHSADVLAAVRAFAPDLGLSLAAPILKPALFELPAHGTLNLHKGRVPDYRGMPPAFWELWNDERQVGCTVHWVDARLDTGDIAAEASVPRAPYSTLRGLQLKLDEVGVELMKDTVKSVLDLTHEKRAQPAGGRTYLKPTLAQIADLERRMKRVQPASAPATKQLVKDMVSNGAFRAWQLGLSRAVKPRITVLLYHRVSDDARDNLTVGVEQFDRQMALLRKYCDVLSIDDVVASRTVPRSRRPAVCVTFDDGYLDNYTHAAQILLRHQIPAGFFVTTGLIGTQLPFPHDQRRGNEFIPLMDWSQLEKMHEYGFTIGSHSVTHIDCVAEDPDLVARELAQSKADLERKLGLRDVLFAYPYGGRQHMNPDRLELVKRAGYAGCLSAYGGSNVATVDRYNVLRRGIHWEFSDDAFLFAALGMT